MIKNDSNYHLRIHTYKESVVIYKPHLQFYEFLMGHFANFYKRLYYPNNKINPQVKSNSKFRY